MSVTISEKGWVVIPAELRKKYNLHPGAEVSVVDYGGVLALVPATSQVVVTACRPLSRMPGRFRQIAMESMAGAAAGAGALR